MNKTIIVLFILFTVPTLAFVVLKKNNLHKVNSNSNNNTQNQNVDSKTTYDFVYPKKVTQTREIIWKFVSNDVVSIYNRRDGIVQDILVDIWDEVKVWQVLAYLFDVWVPGQAGANINEKSEVLKAKQIELQNTINIKEQKINELNQKIAEQYTLLELAWKNKDVKVNQIKNLLDNTYLIEDNSILLKKQAVEVEQKTLELLEKNLEDAISSKESKLKDLENKKKQIFDNSLVVIDKSFDEIIKLVYLWQNRVFLNNTFLNNNDISIYLSAKNNNIRNTFLQKIQDFYAFKNNSWDIEALFNKLEEIYSIVPSVIDNTLISSDISQSMLDSFKNSIFSANNSLIKQRWDFENIINNYETTTRTETEKINSIQNNISKQKEVIILKQKELELSLNSQNKTNINLENELEKIQTSESTNIETIQARIAVLEESLTLLKAQESKNIDDIQNAINIAKSVLNTQYTVSGNNTILSPFDWVISKRNINVWDMISSSMLAFEMVWVSTSLSKKADREVIFNIPQELKNDIINWMEITFVWVNDSSATYSWSIWRISPQVDSSNNTIQVQAKVNDDVSLAHNSNIRVFLKHDKNYLSVPFKSIYNKDWQKVVYFLRESGNLWYRYINIINEIWEMVDVEWENLNENYKIITTPLFFE